MRNAAYDVRKCCQVSDSAASVFVYASMSAFSSASLSASFCVQAALSSASADAAICAMIMRPLSWFWCTWERTSEIVDWIIATICRSLLDWFSATTA